MSIALRRSSPTSLSSAASRALACAARFAAFAFGTFESRRSVSPKDSSHRSRSWSSLRLGDRGALGASLEQVQVRAAPRRVGHEQTVEPLAVPRREARVYPRQEAGVDRTTDVPGEAVQGGERRQLEALLDQLLDRDVHQVGRVVHRDGGLGHRLRRHPSGPLAVGFHAEVPPDRVAVALARARGRDGRDLGAQAEPGAQVRDHGLRHLLLGPRKIAEPLEAFEHHEEGELLGLPAAGGPPRLVDLRERGRVQAGELAGGGTAREARVRRALDQRHPLPFLPSRVLEVIVALAATPAVRRVFTSPDRTTTPSPEDQPPRKPGRRQDALRGPLRLGRSRLRAAGTSRGYR